MQLVNLLFLRTVVLTAVIVLLFVRLNVEITVNDGSRGVVRLVLFG
jgi:hypothetical protein